MTEQDMFGMVKEAGTIVHSCGHTAQCRCRSEHVTHYDNECFACRQKKAEEEEQQKTTPAKRFGELATNVGKKVVGVGALAGGALLHLGKPVPPKQVDPRY